MKSFNVWTFVFQVTPMTKVARKRNHMCVRGACDDPHAGSRLMMSHPPRWHHCRVICQQVCFFCSIINKQYPDQHCVSSALSPYLRFWRNEILSSATFHTSFAPAAPSSGASPQFGWKYLIWVFFSVPFTEHKPVNTFSEHTASGLLGEHDNNLLNYNQRWWF